MQTAGNIVNLCFILRRLNQIWRCSIEVLSMSHPQVSAVKEELHGNVKVYVLEYFPKHHWLFTPVSHLIWALRMGCGVGCGFTRWQFIACSWRTASVLAKQCSGRGGECGGEEVGVCYLPQDPWIIGGLWGKKTRMDNIAPPTLSSLLSSPIITCKSHRFGNTPHAWWFPNFIWFLDWLLWTVEDKGLKSEREK